MCCLSRSPFLLQYLHSVHSGDTLQIRLIDLTLVDLAVGQVRQGRVSWPMSATTMWPATPEWSLASAPLPLSYSTFCYIIHLPPVGSPINWSHVSSKLPFQAAFCVTWTTLSRLFQLPAGAAAYPRLALLLHAHPFHSSR